MYYITSVNTSCSSRYQLRRPDRDNFSTPVFLITVPVDRVQSETVLSPLISLYCCTVLCVFNVRRNLLISLINRIIP